MLLLLTSCNRASAKTYVNLSGTENLNNVVRIHLTCSVHTPTSCTGNKRRHAPKNYDIWQSGREIILSGKFKMARFELNEKDDVVYETILGECANSIFIPESYGGKFQILITELETGDMYIGEITL